MDSSEKRFTTFEVEYLCGYVFGCALEAAGLIKGNKLTPEQETLLWQFIDGGMQQLGQKSSLQQQAEEELQRLLDGEDE